MLKDVRHLAYLGLATTSLAGAVIAVAMTAVAADDSNNKDQDNNRNAPVSLLSVIQVPGNPVTSADISWAGCRPRCCRNLFSAISGTLKLSDQAATSTI